MLTRAALLLAAAQTEQPQPRPPADIVVTAPRLDDTERGLRDCIARGCSADQDIDASLAHAENQFVAGRYRDARATLQASLGRNRRAAARFPVQVGELYFANARVANHLGLDRDYRSSTYASLRTLGAGLPPGDHRVLGARMEVAQMTARLRGDATGLRAYRAAADAARRAGREDAALMAELRAAWLDHRGGRGDGALKRVREIAALTDPALYLPAVQARLMLEAIAMGRSGRGAQAPTLDMGGLRPPRVPVLVYAPRYELAQQEGSEDGAGRKNVGARTGVGFGDQWIDVEFLVGADGRVSGVETVRASGDGRWAEPLLRSIRGRIYTPGAAGAPVRRRERYTYTSGLETFTGSRIRVRSATARVEYLDLTPRPAPAGSTR